MNIFLCVIAVLAVIATVYSLYPYKKIMVKASVLGLLILLFLGSVVMPSAIAGSVVKFSDKVDTFKTGVIVLNENLQSLGYFNFVIGVCIGLLALAAIRKSSPPR